MKMIEKLNVLCVPAEVHVRDRWKTSERGSSNIQKQITYLRWETSPRSNKNLALTFKKEQKKELVNLQDNQPKQQNFLNP